MLERFVLDTWAPDYGASIEEMPGQTETTTEVTLGIEPGLWQARGKGRHIGDLPTCGFIDGVRRIEGRLYLERPEQAPVAALVGAWAVGLCVAGAPRARLEEPTIGRMLVVGNGQTSQALVVPCGHGSITYQAHSTAGSDMDALIGALQGSMRLEEAKRADEWVEGHPNGLLFLDGPIQFGHRPHRAIGCIKRQSTGYLPTREGELLMTLRCGERTPLFQLSGAGLQRYSWYVRLADVARGRGALTGLMRCEVLVSCGLEEAVGLADVSAAILPRFASEPHADSRAPQNLYPVVGLERDLKHRLGELALIQRALLGALG